MARNNGVAKASGELILFVDDDVVAAPGLLRAHLEAHRRLGDRCVVIGPMLNPSDHTMSPWVAWEQEMLAKQYRSMHAGQYVATYRQFYTGNASLRRAHFDAVGGFDSTFRRAEDVEVAFRLADRGLSFEFEPSATGYHYAERSYDSWRATAHAYGRNDVIFAPRPRSQFGVGRHPQQLPGTAVAAEGVDAVVRVQRQGRVGRHVVAHRRVHEYPSEAPAGGSPVCVERSVLRRLSPWCGHRDGIDPRLSSPHPARHPPDLTLGPRGRRGRGRCLPSVAGQCPLGRSTTWTVRKNTAPVAHDTSTPPPSTSRTVPASS